MNSVTVTVEMQLKAEVVDTFCRLLPEKIKDTRQRPGCLAIRIVRHDEEPGRVLFIETWESRQAYEDYVAWRTGRGEMDGVAAALAAPLKVNFWPSVVAEA